MKKLCMALLLFCINTVKSTPLINNKSIDDTAPVAYAESELLLMDYKDVALETIVNELAARKKINILLPQGTQALATKITYKGLKKVSWQQAWDIISSFLATVGYTWIDHKTYRSLKKIDNHIRRENLPLYINPHIEDLPNSSDMIQAIFYLANIKVNDSDNPIKDLLDKPEIGMLSKDAFVMTDEKTNALIITDHASTLRAAMRVIKELDLEGVPDGIEIVPLYNVQASYVETLFKDLIALPSDNSGVFPSARKALQQSSYFPANTRIMSIDRTNCVVIMGTNKGIMSVKDFIIKYIDHSLESGRSILHIYNLQYLNAEEFKPTLEALVGSSQQNADQTTSQNSQKSTRLDFQDVIIVAEITKQTDAVSPNSNDSNNSMPSLVSQGIQQGGNRLIIAARDHDWQRIKAIIEQLDVQQPQVILEVLIVDLVIQRTKDLGSQLRNPNTILGGNVNFQSAQLDQIVLPPPVSNDSFGNANNFSTYIPEALKTNLLQFANGNNTNIANDSNTGSLIISLQDSNNSGTWAVWQVLNRCTNASVLAQPFIMATNNKQATITLTQSRYVDSNTASEGGAVKAQKEWIDAPTTINIVPRISKLASTVNLQVVVSADEFPSNSSNNRITRQVQTNANVGDGEILAIGGLIRERVDIVNRKVPLLGDIPVAGWFFKFKQKVRNLSNLMIFVVPRIIKPASKAHIKNYTDKKLTQAQQEMDDQYQSYEMRDAISRWFFKPDIRFGARTIQAFSKNDLVYHNDNQNVTMIAKSEEGSEVVPTPKKTSHRFSRRFTDRQHQLKTLMKSLPDDYQINDNYSSKARNSPTEVPAA